MKIAIATLLCLATTTSAFVPHASRTLSIASRRPIRALEAQKTLEKESTGLVPGTDIPLLDVEVSDFEEVLIKFGVKEDPRVTIPRLLVVCLLAESGCLLESPKIPREITQR